MRVEIQTNLKDNIAKAVKLSRLLQTLDSFVKPRNPRQSFPFHLDPEAVLHLYRQNSTLSHQMTGILKGTRASQTGVNFLEALEYIIEAITTLTHSQYVLEAAENGTEVF